MPEIPNPGLQREFGVGQPDLPFEDKLEQILFARLETTTISTPSTRRPFVEFFKSRFSSQNISEKLFGGNALPGHAIAAAVGMSSAIADYALGLRSEPTILTLAPVAVLVASLLLPFQGYDRLKEKLQAFFITFGPMFTLGTTAGGILATRALEAVNPTPDRLEIINSTIECLDAAVSRLAQLGCLNTLTSDSGPTLLTISNSIGIIGAASVIMAYITVGFMSRRERWDYLSRFNLPTSVARVDTTLLMRKMHMLADRLHNAIGTNDIEDAVAVLEELKEDAYDDPEMDLDEIRRRTRVDRLNRVLDYKNIKLNAGDFISTLIERRGRINTLPDALDEKRKKIVISKAITMLRQLAEGENMTLDEIKEKYINGNGSIDRSSGLPLWLLEQAQEDLVQWHYHSEDTDQQKPRTTRRKGLFER